MAFLPQVHAEQPLAPFDLRQMVAELTSTPGGVHTFSLFHKLRQTLRESSKNGIDWRQIVDGLRPHTAALWQAMPTRERRLFYSRLRPFWEIHRHRMAPAVGKRFDTMRKSGEVRTIAARIVSAHAELDHVRLILGERKTNRLLGIGCSLDNQLHWPGAFEQRGFESCYWLAAGAGLRVSG